MQSVSAQSIREKEIISLLTSRNDDGMRLLCRHYSHALKGVIFSIVKSDETSEDILQESLVKIWNNFSLFDEEKGRLFTWMLNIARNLSIDFLRSAKNKAAAKTEDIDDYVYEADKLSSENYIPEHIGVKELTDKLSPELKSVIDMVYFMGYTQSEAAERLGIPLGTVKTRTRMAINQMRNYFK